MTKPSAGNAFRLFLLVISGIQGREVTAARRKFHQVQYYFGAGRGSSKRLPTRRLVEGLSESGYAGCSEDVALIMFGFGMTGMRRKDRPSAKAHRVTSIPGQLLAADFADFADGCGCAALSSRSEDCKPTIRAIRAIRGKSLPTAMTMRWP